MAVLPDSVLDSRAAAYLKEEYRAEGIDVDGIQNGYVLLSGAKMLGIALLSMAVTILVSFLAARVAAALGRELRGRVFRKVVGFSHTEFDHFSTASLITRSTNDIQQIQMLFVMLLRIVFYAPIMGVGGVFKVMSTNGVNGLDHRGGGAGDHRDRLGAVCGGHAEIQSHAEAGR